jgi:hypothetical protein
MEKFKRVGLETASNVIHAAGDPFLCEACKLTENELKLIVMTLRSHFNLKLIQRFQENAREMGEEDGIPPAPVQVGAMQLTD